MGLCYRLQVDTMKKKIAILKPNEQHLPDVEKTFFAELSFGTYDESTVMLTADDLIVDESGRIGVDFEKLGPLPAGARFGITSEELVKFKNRFRP
ncbi:MAG: hypothetical protein C6W55_10515 [Thermobacillus sp.]|nr:MAG: hypothetical protein C6W55_10515 [Thermobacillus sp.]